MEGTNLLEPEQKDNMESITKAMFSVVAEVSVSIDTEDINKTNHFILFITHNIKWFVLYNIHMWFDRYDYQSISPFSRNN